ncbi:nucleic acid/nucleotide deaminase domain-containing protein [Streptomyces sp. NPDC059454]|uniref:nucleic acid/nucleotide deaminase domain-containing protein n=1 Tax=Streptomyces sp. NPDC059454 TaxID=3346836 RepID=UPI0036B6694C
MFYVVDHVEKVGDPQVVRKTDGCDGWIDKLFYDGDCTITSKIRFKAVLDLYMCTAEDLNPSQFTCPSGSTVYLGEHPTKELSTEVTHTITIAEYQEDIGPADILFGSWIKCAQKITPGGADGSWGGCAWATVDVAALFAGKILRPIADAVKAVDAAARTGIGFTDAYNALRALGLAEDVILRIGVKGLDGLVKTCTRVRTSLATRVAAVDGCPSGLIAYNSDEMSHWAYRYRTENGYFEGDRNVAVAKVPGWNDPKTGDFIIANSKFSGHSETEILDKLKTKGFTPDQITALYTERQPCPKCASELADSLKQGTPASWSVPYHPDFAREARELLDEYVRRAGGGRVAHSVSNDQSIGEEDAHGRVRIRPGSEISARGHRSAQRAG